jgi:hypothetical protein
VLNAHNSHLLARGKSHTSRDYVYQIRFSVSIWAGIVGGTAQVVSRQLAILADTVRSQVGFLLDSVALEQVFFEYFCFPYRF